MWEGERGGVGQVRLCVFFLQAEDGIRDSSVTGVETCALPISRTRLKVLSQETLDDNSKTFAPGEESPRCAITMGIGTILEARKVLLLATCASKSAAVAKAIEGPITSAVSASALQLHPDLTFIIDDAAPSQLTHPHSYHRVPQITPLLPPNLLP